uniref:hypothetical protein n=1 Tax=Paenibacillus sp. TaxID=58172 RepID=UPI0028AC6CD2
VRLRKRCVGSNPTLSVLNYMRRASIMGALFLLYKIISRWLDAIYMELRKYPGQITLMSDLSFFNLNYK